jgi:iron complex outermembrane recepter protein
MPANSMRKLRARAVAFALCLLSVAHPLRAQTAVSTLAGVSGAETATASPETDRLVIIVTGTREKNLEAWESAAPIQIVSSMELLSTGRPDLSGALAQLVPSFVAQGFGPDMSNLTLQARLRGLSPNDTLILVNGKRRHTTANLAVDTGSPYTGGASADLNFIPMSAVDHIEVLTEGAAAQYGPDAIAGVINIILKRNSEGGAVDGTYGGYFDGGGTTSNVQGEAGFQPVPNSFVNLTVQVYNHGHSNRGNIDPRVVDPTLTDAADGGTYPNTNIPLAPGYPYLNMFQGDAEVHSKLVAYNADFSLFDDMHFYSFGTYGYKDAKSYENYRLPSTVSYTDPATKVTTYPYPYGFNPLEEGKEDDFQVNAGFKGAIAGWTWDLGTGYGEDHFEMYTINSANVSLYAETGASPTDFYDGKFISTQWTTTLDIDRDFTVGLAGPLNVAFGAEYRRETFQIGASTDPASYIDGGAQSFPGFAPLNAVEASRKSYAGYADLAAKVIPGLRLDAAGRFEHYSDFGSATVGKLSARWDITPLFALRGTVSSGFRAPTLTEEHYTAVNVGPTTAFGQLAPDGPGSAMLGIGNGLQPERSTSFSLGVVLRPLENLSAAIDAYQITLTNRIVGSGTIYGTVRGVPYNGAVNVNLALAQSGLSIDPQVLANGDTGINIFANGIDTRTRGVELTLVSPNDYRFGHIDWSVLGSFNHSVVTREIVPPPGLGGQALFDATAIADVTTATPRFVLNLGAHWTVSAFYLDLHEIIYGSSSDYENDRADNAAGVPMYYKTTIATIPLTNLEIGLHVVKGLTVAAGANNLFNRYPNQLNPALTAAYYAYEDNAGVVKYPTFSPLGIDGGFYYVRAGYRF